MSASRLSPRSVLEAAGRYIQSHPEELARVFHNALALRFGLPLAAYRWLLDQLLAGGEARGVQIEAIPPGLRVSGNVVLEDTPLFAGADLYVERVQLGPELMQLVLRVENVRMKAHGERKTHLSALINSGALDLSNVGNFIAHLPDIPDFLQASRDNRVIVDFMQVPALADNQRVREALGLLTAIVTVDGIETDDQHLDVHLRPLPDGVSPALSAANSVVFQPSLRRAKGLVPRRLRSVEGRFREMISNISGRGDQGSPHDR